MSDRNRVQPARSDPDVLGLQAILTVVTGLRVL
jgi:hypothetical protein